MPSYACLIFLFLFSFLTSFGASALQPSYESYLYHYCPNTTTYSRNSTYFTNLRTLLSSLSSRNASYSTGFQNTTVGQAPERVTGLFLCRGDVSPEVCRSCVAFAVNETLNRCPNERAAVLYYDKCMLRYSNRNILSTLIYDGRLTLMSISTISSDQNQIDRFIGFVSSTMRKAAIEAANSSRKFDARKTNFTAFQTLYGLLQCTPDLTRQDCLSCLQKCNDDMARLLNRIGGRISLPSCSSRYELYPFYDESAVRTPPPPPVSNPRPGKGGNSYVRTIAVVVPITAVLLLFVAVCSVRAKKKKTICVKKKETEPLAEDGDDITTAGSLQFDFKAIEAATSNFLPSNKLGQGGFGEVYKLLPLPRASL